MTFYKNQSSFLWLPSNLIEGIFIIACLVQVTGANKGIGLEIVRALCRHFGQDGVVYLTARNNGRGLAAVELLQKEGLDPKFHLLDVTDQSTIDKLRTHLEIEHGGIDILINNAGILPLVSVNCPIKHTLRYTKVCHYDCSYFSFENGLSSRLVLCFCFLCCTFFCS